MQHVFISSSQHINLTGLGATDPGTVGRLARVGRLQPAAASRMPKVDFLGGEGPVLASGDFSADPLAG